MLQSRSSSVRVEFDLSASDNLVTPSSPIILTILGENGSIRFCYGQDRVKRVMNWIGVLQII
jgi:hypothetical protein